MRLRRTGASVSYFTSTSSTHAASRPADMRRLRAMTASEQRRRTHDAHCTSATPTHTEKAARCHPYAGAAGALSARSSAGATSWESSVASTKSAAQASPAACGRCSAAARNLMQTVLKRPIGLPRLCLAHPASGAPRSPPSYSPGGAPRGQRWGRLWDTGAWPGGRASSTM